VDLPCDRVNRGAELRSRDLLADVGNRNAHVVSFGDVPLSRPNFGPAATRDSRLFRVRMQRDFADDSVCACATPPAFL
jgi:hypothetical protein